MKGYDMSRLLEWNNLQEAADYLTDESGEIWTPRKLLDAGKEGWLKLHFVLPPGMETWAGRDKEWMGDLPQLRGIDIAALLRDSIISVKWGVHVHPVTKHETVVELSPVPIINFFDIRIRGCELEAIAGFKGTEIKLPASLWRYLEEFKPDKLEAFVTCEQAESLRIETSSVEQVPSAANMKTVTDTSLSNDWKVNARAIGKRTHEAQPLLNVEQIADKVRKEMTKQKNEGKPGMTGRGGKIPSADTIKRHALTGIKS